MPSNATGGRPRMEIEKVSVNALRISVMHSKRVLTKHMARLGRQQSLL